MKRWILALLACCLMSPGLAQTLSWQHLPNTGLPLTTLGTRFEDVFFTSYDTGFAVNLHGKIYRTTDGGSTWTVRNDTLATGFLKFRAVEFLADKQTGIAGTVAAGYVLRTTDGGATWTDISAAVPDSSALPAYAAPDTRRICGIAHFGDNFYGVGWWGAKRPRLFKSTDKGLSWQTSFIDSNLATGLVDVVFRSADTGFACGRSTGNSQRAPASVILRTTDGGDTWTRVFADSLIAGYVWKLQFVGRDTGFGAIQPLYSDTVAMVKTIDGGLHWNIVGTGFSSTSISTNPTANQQYTQGTGFVNGRTGWIGGYYNGLFETNDGGASWQYLPFGANLNRFFVMDSKHVYAGGRGVYRWGDSLNFSLKVPALPAAPMPRLHPVHPNPASGPVTIAFDLLERTAVSLSVVNVDARRAEQLDQNVLPAGHYEYTWNSGGHPPGTYLVWLGTDEWPMSQKFTVR